MSEPVTTADVMNVTNRYLLPAAFPELLGYFTRVTSRPNAIYRQAQLEVALNNVGADFCTARDIGDRYWYGMYGDDG